jgi:dihydroorotate dehydrogenase
MSEFWRAENNTCQKFDVGVKNLSCVKFLPGILLPKIGKRLHSHLIDTVTVYCHLFVIVKIACMQEPCQTIKLVLSGQICPTLR